MKLSILENNFAVCQLLPNDSIPVWVQQNSFWAMTKTDSELSIVCVDQYIPINVIAEKNWKIIKVVGPLDFALTGILASIAAPLALEKISIFAISTFDTDYILVKEQNLELARRVLTQAGFSF